MRLRALATGALTIATLLGIGVPEALASRLHIPAGSEQLLVVSSPTADPPAPGYLAQFRAYQRSAPDGRWRQVLGPWQAETGSGHLVAGAQRREGDGATPTGVYSIGPTMYGVEPDPGGLRYRYRRLVCGDWWDEDPYSSQYNRFVALDCGATPDFGGGSEALWTETVAYPYFAVIDFNTDPVRGGSRAPGSAIFLHSWVYGPTEGCVALREWRLLEVLRWLDPARRPVIEIGTDAELARLSSG